MTIFRRGQRRSKLFVLAFALLSAAVAKIMLSSSNDEFAYAVSAPETARKGTNKWDSSRSVVIGMASGYGLNVFKSFVGSLRATGYDGHIILGIKPDAPKDVLKYLASQNVTAKRVEMGTCTYHNRTQNNGKPSTEQKCAMAYPDYKIQWGRFPLARDWLLECAECTDGVMLTDTRDAYFQSDPFEYVEDPHPLMVFQEHPNLTTSHWLTNGPVKICRDTDFFETDPKPMLCSGSVMGSREGIVEYIDVMVEEFDYWSSHNKCRSDMIGDDQSIHNYLYYTDKFSGAFSIRHRTGPIHVVGYEANVIFRKRIKEVFDRGGYEKLIDAESWVNLNGYHNLPRDWWDWMPAEYGLIDPKTGYILNLDGRPSPQVHQFDRFGIPVNKFLDRMEREAWNKK